ncbi:hypothetical protein HAV15_005166 [Penicillium sp. str. |nr:hypothetical protein HAV15_005166 [Penicillium sp. str. \
MSFFWRRKSRVVEINDIDQPRHHAPRSESVEVNGKNPGDRRRTSVGVNRKSHGRRRRDSTDDDCFDASSQTGTRAISRQSGNRTSTEAHGRRRESPATRSSYHPDSNEKPKTHTGHKSGGSNDNQNCAGEPVEIRFYDLRTNATISSPLGRAIPHGRDLNHLDAAAANKLMQTFKDKGISHCFMGGYAVALLGGERVTEDVDILTASSRRDLLLKPPLFWNELQLATDCPAPDGWILLNPNMTLYLITKPEDLPERQLSLPVKILHPSVLVLTKLQTWSKAHFATRSADHDRVVPDQEDILTILNWLSKKNMKVSYAGFTGEQRRKLAPLLATLFWTSEASRKLLAETMTPEDLRDALNAYTGHDRFH